MINRKGGDDDDIPTKPHQRPTTTTAMPPDSPPAGMSRQDSLRLNSPAPRPLERQPTLKDLQQQAEEGVEEILEQMRGALKARGAVGLHGLARNFRLCDSDRSGKLDQHEVDRCLKMCKLPLPKEQLARLLRYCDEDADGSVDYEEFLRVVRGPLPVRRRRIVVQVFNAIDNLQRSSGCCRMDGKLTVEDIKGVYSAKEHPEVKAGRKHESAVLQEMLETFEGRKGNRDGCVSLSEWLEYYEALSASIENDDHFNTTVSGAWAKLFNGEKGRLALPISSEKIDDIEKRLTDAIRSRSSGTSEGRALEQVFKQFDTNRNGTIDFKECVAAHALTRPVQPPLARTQCSPAHGPTCPECERTLTNRPDDRAPRAHAVEQVPGSHGAFRLDGGVGWRSHRLHGRADHGPL